MQLLFITCLKESLPAVHRILREAAVPIYSWGPITGVTPSAVADPPAEWFAVGAGEFDSVFVWSFTTAPTVKLLEMITSYNLHNESDFPIRAFVLPVSVYT